MARKLKVSVKDKIYEFEEGISFYEISESFKNDFAYDIVGVKVDNDFMDLSDTLKKPCKVDFFDRSSHYGNTIYLRSAKFILVLAVRNLFGSDVKVIFEYAQDGGIYCVVNNMDVNKKVITQIENEMRNIASNDYKYIKLIVSRLDGIKYLKKHKRFDVVNMLKYISNTYVTIYSLDNLCDYFRGKMAYSTGQIRDFKLTYVRDGGFILSVPEFDSPDIVSSYVHHELFFDKYLDYSNWGKKIGISNASDLNKVLSADSIGQLINLAEAYYDSQLAKVADIISSDKNNIKIILLAGPSSSGKTTTARKLSIYLRSKGFITHSLSIDDYFVDREKTPKDENGEYDFESLKCVDTHLFNSHLSKLLQGKEVLIPTYNFVLGKREFHDENKLKLGDNDIIVIEGLHALNDELTKSISRDIKYKIFIAPLTQLNIDNHNFTHSSDIRKLRRIIRDNRTRGKSASETLKMWIKIREGELKNIYPFQDDADVIVNSSLLYEVCVLKTYAEPLLFNVSEDDFIYPEALRLINFLRNFLPMPSDLIPPDSVIREFIGGSCFKN